MADSGRDPAPTWVDCETGERPRWLRIGIVEIALLALGVLLIVLSADLGEPWRLVILVVGCALAGFIVWSILILGLMAVISLELRQPKAAWVVVPATVAVILLVGRLGDWVFSH